MAAGLMAYHILVERPDVGDKWAIQFGDKDKDVVRDEREDYRYQGSKLGNLKILRVANARQATCDAAVAALNAK